MKNLVIFLSVLVLAFAYQSALYSKGNVSLEDEVTYIRYNVTAIEHDYSPNDKSSKGKAYEKLITKADKLVLLYPDKPEPYTWRGICKSAQAKYLGFRALSNVKKARKDLEKSIAISPNSSGAAAYNALAMLYYKVPSPPLAFGNKEKAEEYFKKALSISSNIDTNYRYGEFLLEERRINEAKKYLNKAYGLPNRPGRKEDSLKKVEIKELLDTLNEKDKDNA